MEFIPARIAIVVDKSTLSRVLIEESGVFGICVPTAAFVDTAYAVGSVSGREQDKFSRYQIAAHAGAHTGVPLIEAGCAAWLECRLLPEAGSQEKYDTCFGEVLSAAADTRIFHDGRWHFTPENHALHSIHHLGGGQFVLSGETVQAKPQ